jgi:hypothetical protein
MGAELFDKFKQKISLHGHWGTGCEFTFSISTWAHTHSILIQYVHDPAICLYVCLDVFILWVKVQKCFEFNFMKVYDKFVWVIVAMVSSAIWTKHARVSFSKTIKLRKLTKFRKLWNLHCTYFCNLFHFLALYVYY